MLSRKKECEKIRAANVIKADKGFDIDPDLKHTGLNLNVPRFLKDKPQFEEIKVFQTQIVARHRIHVECAIGKVRRFQISSNGLIISSLRTNYQQQTMYCLLFNFIDPVLTDKKME